MLMYSLSDAARYISVYIIVFYIVYWKLFFLSTSDGSSSRPVTAVKKDGDKELPKVDPTVRRVDSKSYSASIFQ